MSRAVRKEGVLFGIIFSILVPSLAWSQEEEEGDELAQDSLEEEEEEQQIENPEQEISEENDFDESAPTVVDEEDEPEIEDPEQEEGIDRHEPPEERYWMIGARWRMIMIPDWLLESFLDFPSNGTGAPFSIDYAGGVEFTTRKNRLSITGSIWYARYTTYGAFLATEKGDPTDPEFIDPDIHMLFFTVDFMHSYMFTDWFGITYGGGLGFGVKLSGTIMRNEAYEYGGEFLRCEGPDQLNDSAQSCGQHGDEFYNEEDPNLWPVYPWLNILIGLRFKVLRHLEINVDGGVGLGFLFGIKANYIF